MALPETDRDTPARWKPAGAAESGILEVLETPVRDYQRVDAPLDLTDAETEFPLPMRPLRRLGDRRHVGASSRMSGGAR